MSSQAAILDAPPAAVQRQLSQLADGLDATVPAKHLDRNLLIGT